jgi:CRISPR-associated protein Csd1
MILQSLKEYYDRKPGMPPEGFEEKEFPFIIVIDEKGCFITLEDTREQTGKRLTGKKYWVPRSQSRTGSRSYEITFLLWDHVGYLLQHPESDEKAIKQHKTWLASLESLPPALRADNGITALIQFYGNGGIIAVKKAANWADCAALVSCNMTFRLVHDLEPIPCRPAIQEYVKRLGSQKKGDIGRCLVTGELDEIVRVHGRTPISKDSKSLVNFQKHSGYDSYGKEQGYNAPIGKHAEFAYTTALNTLLKSNKSRMQIGDAATVFWAAKDTDSGFEDFFGELWMDNPDRNVAAVKSLFTAPRTGVFVTDEDATSFFVLGLAPNMARIAVRFWIKATVSNMAARIRQHFNDINIICPVYEAHGQLSLNALLAATANETKAANNKPNIVSYHGKHYDVKPNLAGDTMRAILEGLPYPLTMLHAAIRRIRAEREIAYPKAALIKACINRATRYQNPTIKEELTVSLDDANMNIGYRLGRLFATLEKIQSEANPGINATIRDRCYGAASSTPVTIFGNLMRLKNHHLAKLDNPGRRIYFEKLLCQIMDSVDDFPAHLILADQGRFAIGYYHQMQSFYTKKS